MMRPASKVTASASESCENLVPMVKAHIFDQYKSFVDSVCRHGAQPGALYSFLNVHPKELNADQIKLHNNEDYLARQYAIAMVQLLVTDSSFFSDYVQVIRLISQQVIINQQLTAGADRLRRDKLFNDEIDLPGMTMKSVQDTHTVFQVMEHLCIALFRRGPLRSEALNIHSCDYGLLVAEPLLGMKHLTSILERLGYEDSRTSDALINFGASAAPGTQAAKQASGGESYSKAFQLVIRDNLLAYHADHSNSARNGANTAATNPQLNNIQKHMKQLVEDQLAKWLRSAFEFFLIKNESRLAIELGGKLQERLLGNHAMADHKANCNVKKHTDIEPEVFGLLAALWRILVLLCGSSSLGEREIDSLQSIDSLVKWVRDCGSPYAVLFALEKLVSNLFKEAKSNDNNVGSAGVNTSAEHRPNPVSLADIEEQFARFASNSELLRPDQEQHTETGAAAETNLPNPQSAALAERITSLSGWIAGIPASLGSWSAVTTKRV